MSPIDLTTAIPVSNEERNLVSCPQAIGLDLARRFVVIDSVSTDATAAVVPAHRAEVLRFHWDGRFPMNCSSYLLHYIPATTWVLFFYADEILTPTVKREITTSMLSCYD